MDEKFGPNTALVEGFFARLREGLTLVQWIVISQAGKFAAPWRDACQRAQDAAKEIGIKNLLLTTVRNDTALWENTHAPATALGLVIGATLALAVKGKIVQQDFNELYSPFTTTISLETLEQEVASPTLPSL